MTAERLMLIGGVAAFVLTLYWVRSRDLLERYAVGWVGVSLLLLVLGLFPQLIERLAEAARLSYPAAVLFMALGIVYLFSFTVSVSLTHQYRRSMRLVQQIGLLEHRIRELEAGRERSTEPGPARDH